jgi:hypothetical protein
MQTQTENEQAKMVQPIATDEYFLFLGDYTAPSPEKPKCELCYGNGPVDGTKCPNCGEWRF